MLTISAFEPPDLADVIHFVEEIQEHERTEVPDLKAGHEIGADYANFLVQTVAERNGCIRLARTQTGVVGFACAWIEKDDDPLVRDDARSHAYVSDLFVEHAWRRLGMASRLLEAMETEMISRGCRRIRVCSKAANRAAIQCYQTAGYLPYEIIFAKRLNIADEPVTGTGTR
jgi:ribosomal protein S18 acetylase RimI-like enzyme